MNWSRIPPVARRIFVLLTASAVDLLVSLTHPCSDAIYTCKWCHSASHTWDTNNIRTPLAVSNINNVSGERKQFGTTPRDNRALNQKTIKPYQKKKKKKKSKGFRLTIHDVAAGYDGDDLTDVCLFVFAETAAISRFILYLLSFWMVGMVKHLHKTFPTDCGEKLQWWRRWQHQEQRQQPPQPPQGNRTPRQTSCSYIIIIVFLKILLYSSSL